MQMNNNFLIILIEKKPLCISDVNVCINTFNKATVLVSNICQLPMWISYLVCVSRKVIWLFMVKNKQTKTMSAFTKCKFFNPFTIEIYYWDVQDCNSS